MADSIKASDEDFCISVKISPRLYIDLNPSYQISDMFELKCAPTQNFFDLHAAIEDAIKNNNFDEFIEMMTDDTDLGDIYAAVGRFCCGELKGFILVINPTVVVQKNLRSKTSLQLVTFSDKKTKNKLEKRLNSAGFQEIITVSDRLIFSFQKLTVLLIPGNRLKQPIANLMMKWSSYFNLATGIAYGNSPSKILKRKHSILFNEKTATTLLESADFSNAGSSEFKSKNLPRKKLRTILKEHSTSSFEAGEKKASKSKINLREEGVSLVDGAFDYKWTPESFVEGFLAVQKIASSSKVAATAASILMDPSFRIADCTPILDSTLIDDVSVDVDQVTMTLLINLCTKTIYDHEISS